MKLASKRILWKLFTSFAKPDFMSANKNQQRGFTLVGTTISLLISGFVLGGAWLAYSDMQVQWRVANADRIMDQYAAATMQELTNNLSWAWCGKEIQGGWQNPKWAFYMDDVIQENGLFANWKYQLGPDNVLELTYRPTQGVLFNALAPQWSAYRLNTQYLWTGRTGSPGGVLRSWDRRDRMTVESLFIERNLFTGLRDSSGGGLKWAEVVAVDFTMHYTYNSSPWFGIASRLYGSNYVRERNYTTQIAMRNWDVESNEYRDRLLKSYGISG